MKKINLVILLSFLSYSCSTPEQKFNNYISAGQCEKAIDYIKHSKRRNILNYTTHALSNTSSYVLTGLGYGADVILIVTGGVVVGAALCGPVLAFEAAAKSSGHATGKCMEASMKILGEISSNETFDYSSIGKRTYENTSSWRCSANRDLTKYMLSTSRCYLNRDGSEGVKKAELQLNLLEGNQIFYECLSNEERNKIHELRKVLDKKKT